MPGAVPDARVRIQARAATGAGRRVMIDHDGGTAICRSVSPSGPLPARFLQDRNRRQDTREGYYSPSLDGG